MANLLENANSFNASLGTYMGTWMKELAFADLERQKGWLEAVEELSKPDKDGNIPTITLHSGISGSDGKLISGADITFPTIIALLGEQFAAETATYTTDMTVNSSVVDDTAAQEEEKGSASGEGNILGFKVKVSMSVSASESQDHKRESDYSNTTHAELQMSRVKTPEPIQKILQAYLSIIDVECEIAKAKINNAGTEKVKQELVNKNNPQPSS